MILASQTLTSAVETLKQIVEDMESCSQDLFEGWGDLCDLAGDRIAKIGQELNTEIAFIEKLAEGARILEVKE